MADQSNQIPQLQNLRTTSQLLKSTVVLFSNNLFTFLFLSLLLFSFRSFVDSGSRNVISYVDRDPSLKSLLQRLQMHPTRQQVSTTRSLTRRRPFLHLTRVGTLDDDFFSGEDDPDKGSFLNPNRKSTINGSSLFLYNFKPGIMDNGVNVYETVRFGVQFKVHDVLIEENGGFDKNETLADDDDDDFEMVYRGYGAEVQLGYKDAKAMFVFVTYLSLFYVWVILGFTVVYSLILGVIFVAVTVDLLGKFFSPASMIYVGSKIGVKRVTGFILMRWAVRDALTQIIGLYYFGEIEDQYSFFKLFVRLKLMPLSISSNWIQGFEEEISGFLFTWFLIDVVVSFVFAVDAWVTLVDSRKRGREIVKEGFYLISMMFHQAVQLKCFESFLCGSAARWVLSRVFGRVLASVLQSTFEVYFMIAWLMLYFGARCKDAIWEGRRFGRRELEAWLVR